MNYAAARVGICVLLVAMLHLGGCGGTSQQSETTGNRSRTEIAPPVAQLEALLMAELARLGKDPDRTAAAAPQSEDNCVFNLAARVIDPDGTGPGLPTAVELSWVERCIGDYNQDGLVGVSDLTPLGQRFNAEVCYCDAEVRGIGFWPMDNPLDDDGVGAGSPAPPGCPADNWRLARIDGNADGLIGVSDITPIAQHWQERLNGYRVYRVRPGEADFSLLPNPDDPGLGYTVPRSAAFPPGSTSADPTRPVHYVFVDEQLGAASGWYEYYVAPYDADEDQEGWRSNIAPANLDGGGGGTIPPHAVLTPDTDYGSVPLTVEYDASQSWDADGQIVKFEWDMDGDSSTWELDSGTNPLLSGITYNTPGTREQWVRVTDNDGLMAVASAKVPVSAAGGNLPPVAMVNADPPEGDVPLQVSWDASGSYDIDGEIVQYEWDCDNDPTTWEYNSGTTPTMGMTYHTSGQQTQHVRVTDDEGLTDVGVGIAHVYGGANQPPVAAITANVSEANTMQIIFFDASGSYDPDGTIQQYDWDYDGNGTIDFTTTVPTTTTAFEQGGMYDASVTVTDDQGATASSSMGLLIHGWRITEVRITDVEGLSDVSMVSLALAGGYPFIAFATYGNQQGQERNLYYVQASDTWGSAWGSVTILAEPPANRKLTLQNIEVVNGHPAVVYLSGDVLFGSAPEQLHYIRANDPEGNEWPASSVTLDTISFAEHIWCWSLRVIGDHPAVAYEIDQDPSPSSYNCHVAFMRAGDETGTSWPTRTLVAQNSGNGISLIELPGMIGVPGIVHIDASKALRIERAQNVDGTSWHPSTVISGFGEAAYVVAAGYVDGVPSVLYSGPDTPTGCGLFFQQSSSPEGITWTIPRVNILSYPNDIGGISLAVISNLPAASLSFQPSGLHPHLQYVGAVDAAGQTWQGPVDLVSVFSGYQFVGASSMIEINGQPAIAYCTASGRELWFCRRY